MQFLTFEILAETGLQKRISLKLNNVEQMIAHHDHLEIIFNKTARDAYKTIKIYVMNPDDLLSKIIIKHKKPPIFLINRWIERLDVLELGESRNYKGFEIR